MSFIQYLKDTRGELRHVAWPTRLQTVIYTTLVIAISLFISAYLGLFDYILTTGLGRGLLLLPEHNTQLIEESASSTITFDTPAEAQ